MREERKALLGNAQLCLRQWKLDSNFDLKIMGGEEFIEKGYDEKRRMKYY